MSFNIRKDNGLRHCWFGQRSIYKSSLIGSCSIWIQRHWYLPIWQTFIFWPRLFGYIYDQYTTRTNRNLIERTKQRKSCRDIGSRVVRDLSGISSTWIFLVRPLKNPNLQVCRLNSRPRWYFLVYKWVTSISKMSVFPASNSLSWASATSHTSLR